jgi:hypothetical protein
MLCMGVCVHGRGAFDTKCVCVCECITWVTLRESRGANSQNLLCNPGVPEQESIFQVLLVGVCLICYLKGHSRFHAIDYIKRNEVQLVNFLVDTGICLGPDVDESVTNTYVKDAIRQCKKKRIGTKKAYPRLF